jgi:arsenate reductase
LKGTEKHNTLVKPLLGRGLGRLTLYGIPNCDTTKKAMGWLKKNKFDFSFHDYKQEGISKEKLEAWCNKLGWETIFNKRSTTWRELSDAEQKKVVDQSTAIKTMMQYNSIIKRPVIEYKTKLIVGFNEHDLKGLSIKN